MLKRLGLLLAFSGIALLPVDGLASSAPPRLLNTSIKAAYTTRTTGHSDDGRTNTNPRLHELTIYVSSLGRIFVKHFTQNGRSKTSQIEPDQTFRFENEKMIGVFQGVSGAGELTIAFSPDFQSCNLSLISGTDNGKPKVWIGPDGHKWSTTEPIVFTPRTCSVTPGNALAN
jgi:hypothetical protein